MKVDGQAIDLNDEKNVVIRFRGDVPAWALLPHVLMMVLTVIWSMATILFAISNIPAYKRTMGVTIIFLLIGGFILGPIVQKYSFGQFWTGWPLGEDLTDNKLAVVSETTTYNVTEYRPIGTRPGQACPGWPRPSKAKERWPASSFTTPAGKRPWK